MVVDPVHNGGILDRERKPMILDSLRPLLFENRLYYQLALWTLAKAVYAPAKYEDVVGAEMRREVITQQAKDGIRSASNLVGDDDFENTLKANGWDAAL